LVPQLDAPWSAHTPPGSGAPVGTFVHWPSVPASAHDLHAPVHAVAQHTPCAHTLLAHSPAAEHAAPIGFLPHDPPLHTFPVLHWALVEHCPKHLLPLHANGRHVSAAGATHFAVASQVEAGVYIALAQVSGAHTVPGAYLRHDPAPSHLPSVPPVDAGCAAQPLRGSVAPAGTVEQLPIADGSAHVLHGPLQALSQQTPSTQNPLAQAAATLQAWPLLLVPQLPFWQVRGATHSASLVQWLMHAPSVHR
jgi:hypothetical protein